MSADGRNAGLPTYNQWTVQIQASRVKAYACPSDFTNVDSLKGFSSYSQNGQVFRVNYVGWTNGLTKYPAGIPDGTSNTVMYSEKIARFNNSLGSEPYQDNYWPDWGPITASNDVGDPTGLAFGSPQASVRAAEAQGVAQSGRPSSAIRLSSQRCSTEAFGASRQVLVSRPGGPRILRTVAKPSAATGEPNRSPHMPRDDHSDHRVLLPETSNVAFPAILRCSILCAVALLFVVLSGCGRSPRTVSGKVSYQGKNLKGGSVAFVSTEGLPSGTGTINEDGTYEIRDVKSGKYRIAVDTESLLPSREANPYGKGSMKMPNKEESPSGPPPGAQIPEGYKPSSAADADATQKNNVKRYVKIPPAIQQARRIRARIHGGRRSPDSRHRTQMTASPGSVSC